MNPKDEKIHLKIARFRKERKLSQVEFAELLGISQNAYSMIERGKTNLTVDRIKQIADVLGVKYYDLFSGISSDIENTENEQIALLKEELRLSHLKYSQGIKEISKKITAEHIEEKRLLREMLKEKDKVIALLEEKIKMLENQLIKRF